MTGAPVAGWYPDPSDPHQERWWGGSEWTHDTRAVPPPQPALLDVPGGGINPFAAIDAEEARRAAAAVPAVPPEPGYGGYGQTTGAPLGADWNANSQPPFTAAPGFAPQRAFGPPPTNGLATAGLVLSILGLYLLGIIFSVRGLLFANKLAGWGEPPVGRLRAAWGLGIGIAMPLAIAVLSAILVPVALAHQDNLAADGIVRGPLGLPAVYDREAWEQSIYDAWAAEGETVTDVQCPRDAELIVGGGFECTMFYRGMTHRVGIVYTDTDGNYYQTFDGLIPD